MLKEINGEFIYQGVKFDIRTECAIEYLAQLTEQYIKPTVIETEKIVQEADVIAKQPNNEITIKCNRAYKRAGRKGLKGVNFEIAMIS